MSPHLTTLYQPALWRLLLIGTLWLAVGGAAGCASDGTPEAGAGNPAVSGAAAPLEGVYEVQGVTVQAGHGVEREIRGHMTLRADEEHYTSQLELETTVPGAVSGAPAALRGHGEGLRTGSVLTGITETSLEVHASGNSNAAGEAGLAESERWRLSTAVARVDEQGAITIHLQNHPREGEDYAPSVSVLHAVRIGNIGQRGLPDVAAPPPLD